MEGQLFFREAISTDVQIFGWSRTRLFRIKLGTLFPRNITYSEYLKFQTFPEKMFKETYLKNVSTWLESLEEYLRRRRSVVSEREASSVLVAEQKNR